MTKWDILKLDSEMMATDLGLGFIAILLWPLYPLALLYSKLNPAEDYLDEDEDEEDR